MATGFLDSPDPTGITTMFTFIVAGHARDHDADQRVRRPAAVDPQQHRRGDRDPRHVRLRADPAVLREPPVAVDPVRHRRRGGGDGRQLPPGLPARHVHGPVRRLRLRHGRDVRRGDARREPPGAARRPVVDLDLRRSSGRSSCSPSSCRSRASRPRSRRARPAASRSPRRSSRTSRPSSSAGITVGELYLFVILASVFVCTLAIQGATTRMMFSMGRDRHLPLGERLGPGQPHASRRRPTRPSRVGVLAAMPILVTGPLRRVRPGDRGDRPDLPELLPVQHRRADRPAQGLAAPEGLVQPRPLGHAREHPGPRSGAAR